MNILCINSGSSSIKFALLNYNAFKNTNKKRGYLNLNNINISYYYITSLERIYDGKIEEIGTPYSSFYYEGPYGKKSDSINFKDHFSALLFIINDFINSGVSIDTVVHRFVHGGTIYKKPLLVKKSDLKKLSDLNELAPLHNPSNFLGLKTTMDLIPEASQVCVFDTAFHATIPKYASIYPLPIEYYENLHIKKFGFHGISYSYLTKILNIAGLKFNKLILCHLGNGASIAAVKNGRSVDTSMGYTPLEGLMMGTRSGDIDPSLAFILKNKLKISEDERSNAAFGGTLYNIFNKKSGLLGISKKTYDLKELLENHDKYSELAIKMFCYRISKYIGAYSAALNGLDGLVFSGGIGENSYFVREQVCKSLTYLGIKLNNKKNIEASNNIEHLNLLGKIKTENSIFVINKNNKNKNHNNNTKGLNSLESCKYSINYNNNMNNITTPCVMVVKTDEEIMMASEALNLMAS